MINIYNSGVCARRSLDMASWTDRVCVCECVCACVCVWCACVCMRVIE